MEIVVLTGMGASRRRWKRRGAGRGIISPSPADADQILAAFEKSGENRNRKNVAADAGSVPAASLARVEWEHIQRILTDCGGNILGGAGAGDSSKSLQRKLSKYPPMD